MDQTKFAFALILLTFAISQCTPKSEPSTQQQPDRISVLFDTDANNELDDQHALAYLLLNQQDFDIRGITVNATPSGGAIALHHDEAARIMSLCGFENLPLADGADGSFQDIRSTIGSPAYDGKAGVDLIRTKASALAAGKLTLIAVGKLTNVALALAVDSTLADKIHLVWLGSNYPEPGEYNQDNDTIALNYLLSTSIEFDMVTVRYGKPSGTDAVKITQDEVKTRMPGLGPHASKPITGRHGGEFVTFGDYSVNLFEHSHYYGTPPSRALFDLAAVAIVKNPAWAISHEIPAPILINNQWVERPDNSRKITVWENFDRDAIIADLFASLTQ